MKKIKNKKEVTIRSSCAEYLTYVSLVGDDAERFKVNNERVAQFEKYRVVQDKLYKNDFDKLLEETNMLKD